MQYTVHSIAPAIRFVLHSEIWSPFRHISASCSYVDYHSSLHVTPVTFNHISPFLYPIYVLGALHLSFILQLISLSLPTFSPSTVYFASQPILWSLHSHIVCHLPMPHLSTCCLLCPIFFWNSQLFFIVLLLLHIFVPSSSPSSFYHLHHHFVVVNAYVITTPPSSC